MDTNVNNLLLRNPHLIEIEWEDHFQMVYLQLLYLLHHDKKITYYYLQLTLFNIWNAAFYQYKCGFLCFINIYCIHGEYNETNFGRIVSWQVSSELADVAWYFPEDAVLKHYMMDKERIKRKPFWNHTTGRLALKPEEAFFHLSISLTWTAISSIALLFFSPPSYRQL